MKVRTITLAALTALLIIAAPAQAETWRIEAEDMVKFGNYQVVNDPAASGGQYVSMTGAGAKLRGRIAKTSPNTGLPWTHFHVRTKDPALCGVEWARWSLWTRSDPDNLPGQNLPWSYLHAWEYVWGTTWYTRTGLLSSPYYNDPEHYPTRWMRAELEFIDPYSDATCTRTLHVDYVELSN